ncbi:MAG: DUF2155 domain-containing protein [Pseudomonadota bacterium]
MTVRLAALIGVMLFALAAPLGAQIVVEELKPKFEKAPEGVIYDDSYREETIEVERPSSRSEPRPMAVLRGLDKISGRVTDVKVAVGDAVKYERLTILVDECREPPADEPADAFVLLTVTDAQVGDETVFSGWMFASSPALSAMDHQRYDIWVLSCATS